MYALRAYADEQYQAALKAREEGRPVAWCMAEAWATPFLNTMDIESVYPENYATVTAAAGDAAAFVEIFYSFIGGFGILESYFGLEIHCLGSIGWETQQDIIFFYMVAYFHIDFFYFVFHCREY